MHRSMLVVKTASYNRNINSCLGSCGSIQPNLRQSPEDLFKSLFLIDF